MRRAYGVMPREELLRDGCVTTDAVRYWCHTTSLSAESATPVDRRLVRRLAMERPLWAFTGYLQRWNSILLEKTYTSTIKYELV